MNADSPQTRSIAIGSEALVTGFSLIGFESMADPDPEEVRDFIDQLTQNHGRAFLVVERYLAKELEDILRPLQQEGGDILMVEVPAIHEPDQLDSWLSSRIAQKFKVSLVEGI
jgi:vacuolar-type H+-ATPase subunit F/Vma7